MKASRMIGSSSTSVVIWVIRARFLTRPQASPSGVSLGQSTPHWLGWRARGPLTFLVFSNWEDMRVIIPKAEIKLRRLSTCVTPARSILNRLRDQFPVEMARTKPDVRWSPCIRMVLNASNSLVRDGFLRTLSMAILRLELYVLNKSSKSRASSWPALGAKISEEFNSRNSKERHTVLAACFRHSRDRLPWIRRPWPWGRGESLLRRKWLLTWNPGRLPAHVPIR